MHAWLLMAWYKGFNCHSNWKELKHSISVTVHISLCIVLRNDTKKQVMKSFKTAHTKKVGLTLNTLGTLFLCSYFLSPWQLITNPHNKSTLVIKLCMAAGDIIQLHIQQK